MYIIMYVCFLTQHEEEPAQSVGAASKDREVEKLSKSAQKNKKKKENRQKAAKEEVSQYLVLSMYVCTCSCWYMETDFVWTIIIMV